MPLVDEEDDAEQQQLAVEQDAFPQIPFEGSDEAEEGWEGSESLELPAQASEHAESIHDLEVCCWPCHAVLAIVSLNDCGFSRLAVAFNDTHLDCFDGVRCIQ